MFSHTVDKGAKCVRAKTMHKVTLVDKNVSPIRQFTSWGIISTEIGFPYGHVLSNNKRLLKEAIAEGIYKRRTSRHLLSLWYQHQSSILRKD
jgi:hypothetical protein